MVRAGTVANSRWRIDGVKHRRGESRYSPSRATLLAMALVRNIVNVVTAIALAALFVLAGLAACLAPPVTHGLSSVFARDDLNPLDRNQLVRVADETRDYSFGAHDELALYQVIYDVDTEYRDNVGFSASASTSTGFPRLDLVSDRNSLPQLKSAFAGASELYCYSEETVSHLDDCYNLVRASVPWAIAIAIIAFAGLVFTGVTGGPRRTHAVLIAAGALVIAAFAALGIWAIVDFAGLFAAFHSLFFSAGSWVFPYDSLLICALPTEFWMGMGAVWLATSVLLSILSLIIGFKLRRRR